MTHYFLVIFVMRRPNNIVNNNGEEIEEASFLEEYFQDNALVFANSTHIPNNFQSLEIEHPNVEMIKIGDYCNSSGYFLSICGLPHLKSIIIGENSFTSSENSYSSCLTSRMEVKDCESLQEISIGRYSFSSCKRLQLSCIVCGISFV